MRSEAVYLDLVTPDAAQAMVMRVCRYPADGICWVWGHLFERGRVFAFTQHDVPCSVRETPLDDAQVSYSVESPHCRVRFDRSGAIGAVTAARARGAFEMHDVRHAAHGPGPILVEIDARFEVGTRAVSNLEGRSEVLGNAQAQVTIGAHSWTLTGASQFHEQVQTTPRFASPFTYGTLRDAGSGAIFIRGPNASRGYWIDGSHATAIDRIELSPPGSQRTIILHAGSQIRTGTLRTTYDYSIAVGNGYRPGSIVVGEIDGRPVSGCVNDFLLDQLRFDRI